MNTKPYVVGTTLALPLIASVATAQAETPANDTPAVTSGIELAAEQLDQVTAGSGTKPRIHPVFKWFPPHFWVKFPPCSKSCSPGAGPGDGRVTTLAIGEEGGIPHYPPTTVTVPAE